MRAGRCLGEKRVELEVESRDSGDLWQGVSKEFLRLVRLSGIRDVEKVYRADDCAAPLLVTSVDVGQVMMNDSDDRCLVVYVRPPPRE